MTDMDKSPYRIRKVDDKNAVIEKHSVNNKTGDDVWTTIGYYNPARPENIARRFVALHLDDGVIGEDLESFLDSVRIAINRAVSVVEGMV